MQTPFTISQHKRKETDMRSRAHFMTHPLHPMLVAFPVGFAIGALGADLLGLAFNYPNAWVVAPYLAAAAVLSGVVAAVPGLVDLFYTVPPNSSAKKRAVTHALVNGCALSVLFVSWLLRDLVGLEPPVAVIALETFAAAGIIYGGFLGGTLVYRNQIGVDHRYAQSTKWSEVRLPASAEPLKVASVDELKINQMRLIRLGERRIVLCRTERGFSAFDDRCTHKGGSLAGGVMISCTVSCPWHGSQFDVLTGNVKAGPAQSPVRTYRVEIRGNDVMLHPEASPAKEDFTRAANV